MPDKPHSTTSCSYLWRHICVRPGGTVTPCCRFQDSEEVSPRLQPNAENLHEIINRPFAQKLREYDLKNQTIPGCIKCDSQTEDGNLSLRYYANLKYSVPAEKPLSISPTHVESLEVFVGSICNLRCLMCEPQLSSAWRQEYLRLGWNVEADIATEKINFSKIVAKLPNLREIKFVGGEPFLAKDHDEILLAIPAEQAAQMSLTYYTNVTIWPSAEIINHWKHFKSINLWLSIDGVGPVNDYIRFPSEWSQVEKITRQFMDLTRSQKGLWVGLNCTVSAVNVFSVAALETWFQKEVGKYLSNACFFMNPLVAPAEQSIGILNTSLRALAAERLGSSPAQIALRAHLQKAKDLSQLREKFLHYTETLDRARGTDLFLVAPELKNLLS